MVFLDCENDPDKVRAFSKLQSTLMSISYLKLSGTISTEDFIANLKLTENGTCQRKRWLIDTLDCHFDFCFEDIQNMVNFFRDRPEESRSDVRVAFYAKSDVTYGLARVVASLAEAIGMDVAVYREIDEAEAFLTAS